MWSLLKFGQFRLIFAHSPFSFLLKKHTKYTVTVVLHQVLDRREHFKFLLKIQKRFNSFTSSKREKVRRKCERERKRDKEKGRASLGKGKVSWRERKRQGPMAEEKRKAAQRGFYDLSGGDKVSGCCVFNGSRPNFKSRAGVPSILFVFMIRWQKWQMSM